MTTGVFFALQIFREREGYHAVTALNGEIALATAVTQKPSLTVTDWMMPRIDGVELCRRLKK
jgi:DNA-binding response OmpR family regulator